METGEEAEQAVVASGNEDVTAEDVTPKKRPFPEILRDCAAQIGVLDLTSQNLLHQANSLEREVFGKLKTGCLVLRVNRLAESLGVPGSSFTS